MTKSTDKVMSSVTIKLYNDWFSTPSASLVESVSISGMEMSDLKGKVREYRLLSMNTDTQAVYRASGRCSR
jgi:hypothetical protein